LTFQREAQFRMKWFRSNIQHGSRLALLALVVQLVLSFGHFHGLAAQAAPNTVVASAQQQSPASPDSDQPSDGCAICAVMAMAGTVLFATPPQLLPPQAVEFSYRTTDAEFVHLRSAHVAFQPRAPPIS
jgi:hypothetical protein